MSENDALKSLIWALRDEDWETLSDAAKKLAERRDVRAVPHLFWVLTKENPPYEVHEAVAEALMKIDFFRTLEALLRQLTGSDLDDRRKAAPALEMLRDPRAVDPLLPVLKHANWEVRKIAAEVLGKLRDTRAVEPLVQVLQQDDTEWVRQAAANALETLGWTPGDTEEELVHYLIAKGAWEEVPKFKTSAIGPLIKALMDERWWRIHWRAAEALGIIGDPRAITPLQQALQNGTQRDAEYAAEALRKIGDPQAMEILIQALQDENSWARKNAERALGKLQDPWAIELLIQALQDSKIRWEVTSALTQIGEPVVTPLLHTLGTEDWHIRYHAMIVFGELIDKVEDPKPVISALLAGMDDENENIRLKAAWSLRSVCDKLKDPERIVSIFVNNLKVTLNSKEVMYDFDEVMDVFIDLVSQWEDFSQIKSILQNALIDKDRMVRGTAAVALAIRADDIENLEILIPGLHEFVEAPITRVELRKALVNIAYRLEDPSPFVPILQKAHAKYYKDYLFDGEVMVDILQVLVDISPKIQDHTLVANALISCYSTAVDYLFYGSYSFIIEEVWNALLTFEEPLISLVVTKLEPIMKIPSFWTGGVNEGWWDDRERLEVLITKLKDPSPVFSWFLYWSEEDVEILFNVLQKVLQHGNWKVRKRVIRALGMIRAAWVIELLIQALQDENTYVRMAAVEALGEIGDTRAVDPLIQALMDEDQRVRRKVAGVLGAIGDPRAETFIQQALEDSDPDVRKAAQEALAKLQKRNKNEI